MAKTWAKISKEIQFDAGHRVPRHGSKCRSVHGHRYRAVVSCRGTIVQEAGAADEGMLIDFGDLKTFMQAEIHDVLDHSLIVYERDVTLIMAMQSIDDNEEDYKQKVVLFPYVPTAENVARWCFQKLQPLVEHHFRDNLVLHQVAIWETPTSAAYFPEDRH